MKWLKGDGPPVDGDLIRAGQLEVLLAQLANLLVLLGTHAAACTGVDLGVWVAVRAPLSRAK